MKIEEIRKIKQQVYQIAAKRGNSKVYVFGSVARGESNDISDIDFLIEMDDNASAFGEGQLNTKPSISWGQIFMLFQPLPFQKLRIKILSNQCKQRQSLDEG